VRAFKLYSTLIFAGALATPGAAIALDAAKATELFEEGKSYMDAKDFAHACPKLSESFALDPQLGTELTLARCYENWNRLASAWNTYVDYLTRADGNPEQADRVKAAKVQRDALAPRLSKLFISVPPSVAALPGLTVTLDGTPLTNQSWGVGTPVDGGLHHVAANATGKKPWQREISVEFERGERAIDVPDLESHNPLSKLRPVGIVVGAVGAVGIGVGVAFGLQAMAANSDSKDNCDATGCEPLGKLRRNDAFHDARISTALVIAGTSLAAVGLTLYLVGSPRDEGRAALTFNPGAAQNGEAMSIGGAF